MKLVRMIGVAGLLTISASADNLNVPTVWDEFNQALSQVLTEGKRRFDGVVGGISSNMKIGENLEKGSYRVEVSLPGYKKEEISVNVECGTDGLPSELKISAKVKEEKKRESKENRSWYFGTKSYESSLTLPTYVDPHSVTASFDNGVLLVNFKASKVDKAKKETISPEIN